MPIKLLLFALVAEAGAYLTLGLSHQKIMPKPGKGLEPRLAVKIDCDKHIKRRHQTLAELGDKYGELFQKDFCGQEAESAKKEYVAYHAVMKDAGPTAIATSRVVVQVSQGTTSRGGAEE